MRRGLVVAVLLCLAGAGLLLLATSRTWMTVDTDPSTLLRHTSHLTGATLAPGARALGLLGLAGVAALPATRSWGRTVVGGLLAIAGLGAGAVVFGFVRDPGDAAAGHVPEAVHTVTHAPTAAPYAALLGAALLLAAGVLTLVRGRSWSALGSSYDAPTAPPKETSAWDALDQGVDPTA